MSESTWGDNFIAAALGPLDATFGKTVTYTDRVEAASSVTADITPTSDFEQTRGLTIFKIARTAITTPRRGETITYDSQSYVIGDVRDNGAGVWNITATAALARE